MASQKATTNIPTGSTKPAKNTTQPRPLPPTALYTTKAFAYTRILLGAASVLSPKFTCGLFQFFISNETALVVRMFGIRGVALGWSILQQRDPEDVKGALWANIGCDLVDLCCLGLTVYQNGVARLPGGILAGGAVMCAGLGFVGLSAL